MLSPTSASRREHSLFVAWHQCGDNTASAYAAMWAAPISWPSTSGTPTTFPSANIGARRTTRNESVRAVVYSGDSVERRLHQRAVLQRSGLRRLHAIVWSKRLLQTRNTADSSTMRTVAVADRAPASRESFDSRRGQRNLQGQSEAVVANGRAGHSNDGLRDQPDLGFLPRTASGKLPGRVYVGPEAGRLSCNALTPQTWRAAAEHRLPRQRCWHSGADRSEIWQAGQRQLRLITRSRRTSSHARSESLQRQSNHGSVACRVLRINDVTAGDMDVPCGQNAKGKSYDCFGDGTDIIGELSTSTSAGEPAYPATVGYDLGTGLARSTPPCCLMRGRITSARRSSAATRTNQFRKCCR